MKFNNPFDEQAVWAILRDSLGLGNKEAHSLVKKLTPYLNRACESALQMDRVELRKELETELQKKYAEREVAVKKREESGGGLTRDELVRTLSRAVLDDEGGMNVQAAALLTKLEGFEAAQQDIKVNIVNYADAPAFYRTEVPEGV